ncbi:unnamed protein product [Gongylonema pulchrum]|uniref:Fibronectin type-III domain-containing protein n=1 Tax=Gongylonema pulchrum TaxID=637853 RepID=A0A183DRU1_9BILA|nr:unnamed protein product [Gongylonema pulchrum]
MILSIFPAGAPKPLLGIEKPRIEQRGSRTLLYWTVGGDTSNVAAYKIELRSDSERDWRQYGGFVPHSPSEIHFRQELPSLATHKHYYARVSATDTSRRVLATSEVTSFTVQCQAPSVVPQNLRLEPVADGIRLSWTWTGQESPECEPYFLITGYQNGGPFSERVSGQLREFTFQNAIGGEWHVEMRAGNRVGTGPSSSPANLHNVPIVLRECWIMVSFPRSLFFPVSSIVPIPVSKGVRVRVPRSICDPRTDFWCRPPGESDDVAVPRHPDEGLLRVLCRLYLAPLCKRLTLCPSVFLKSFW